MENYSSNIIIFFLLLFKIRVKNIRLFLDLIPSLKMLRTAYLRTPNWEGIGSLLYFMAVPYFPVVLNPGAASYPFLLTSRPILELRGAVKY